MSSSDFDSDGLHYQELPGNPTDAFSLHMGTLEHKLCFKILEEADKATGWEIVGANLGETIRQSPVA